MQKNNASKSGSRISLTCRCIIFSAISSSTKNVSSKHTHIYNNKVILVIYSLASMKYTLPRDGN